MEDLMDNLEAVKEDILKTIDEAKRKIEKVFIDLEFSEIKHPCPLNNAADTAGVRVEDCVYRKGSFCEDIEIMPGNSDALCVQILERLREHDLKNA